MNGASQREHSSHPRQGCSRRLAGALFLAACGDDDAGGHRPSRPRPPRPAGTEAPTAPAGGGSRRRCRGDRRLRLVDRRADLGRGGLGVQRGEPRRRDLGRGPGTGDGFAQFCAGETDISDASRPISEEEAQTCADAGIEFIELKIAVDGLSVITSAENTDVDCLRFVDLYALLGPTPTGINNWADAAAIADEIAATVTDLGAVNTPYPDADLTVTAPGEESGTFDSFVELVIARSARRSGSRRTTVPVPTTRRARTTT